MSNAQDSTNKIIKLLLVLIVLLTLISAANFYLLLQDREMLGDVGLSALEDQGPPPDPIFVKVGPMTVNLRPDGYGQRLLYTSISLRVEDQETRRLLELHMPEVHSRLLMLLSGQSAEVLVSPNGKTQLAQQVLALFEEPLTQPQPDLNINAVLFNDFIVQ